MWAWRIDYSRRAMHIVGASFRAACAQRTESAFVCQTMRRQFKNFCDVVDGIVVVNVCAKCATRRSRSRVDTLRCAQVSGSISSLLGRRSARRRPAIRSRTSWHIYLALVAWCAQPFTHLMMVIMVCFDDDTIARFAHNALRIVKELCR